MYFTKWMICIEDHESIQLNGLLTWARGEEWSTKTLLLITWNKPKGFGSCWVVGQPTWWHRNILISKCARKDLIFWQTPKLDQHHRNHPLIRLSGSHAAAANLQALTALFAVSVSGSRPSWFSGPHVWRRLCKGEMWKEKCNFWSKYSPSHCFAELGTAENSPETALSFWQPRS